MPMVNCSHGSYTPKACSCKAKPAGHQKCGKCGGHLDEKVLVQTNF